MPWHARPSRNWFPIPRKRWVSAYRTRQRDSDRTAGHPPGFSGGPTSRAAGKAGSGTDPGRRIPSSRRAGRRHSVREGSWVVAPGPAGLEVANPIYREIIPRALTGVLQESLPVLRAPFIATDGRLLFDKILADFQAFWCQHAEFFLQRQPYSEAAAQLIFMAYLQRSGQRRRLYRREYAVGSGRIDLCVRWPHPGGIQRWAVELKVWREGRPDPLPEGLDQLTGYLARLGLREGTLILFDVRPQATSVERAVPTERNPVHGRDGSFC